MSGRPRVVLYAAQTLPSSAACAVRCSHLARAMRSEGVDLDVWSHAPGDRTTALWIPFTSNRWPTALRLFHEALLAVEVALRLLVRRATARDTVVVFSSPPYVTCFLAAQACRLLGLRFVWDARDVYPEVLFNLGVLRRDSLPGRWLSAATRGLYEAALFVTTPSDSFAAGIRRQVKRAGGVHVIRNGFDDAIISPRAVPRGGAEPFTCINHGLLGRIHNIELLLRVAELVGERDPSVRFVVIGFGPKEELMRARPLPNLRFLGMQPYHAIPSYLADADLGLAFIHDTEGTDGAFPVKVYEYVGAGIPVLVTPHSEAARLVSSTGVGAAFSNDEADAIASMIVEVAHRNERYRSWRAATLTARQGMKRSEWSARFAALLVRETLEGARR